MNTQPEATPHTENVRRLIQQADEASHRHDCALQTATVISAWLIECDEVENDMKTLKDYERFGNLVSVIAEILVKLPEFSV